MGCFWNKPNPILNEKKPNTYKSTDNEQNSPNNNNNNINNNPRIDTYNEKMPNNNEPTFNQNKTNLPTSNINTKIEVSNEKKINYEPNNNNNINNNKNNPRIDTYNEKKPNNNEPTFNQNKTNLPTSNINTKIEVSNVKKINYEPNNSNNNINNNKNNPRIDSHNEKKPYTYQPTFNQNKTKLPTKNIDAKNESPKKINVPRNNNESRSIEKVDQEKLNYELNDLNKLINQYNKWIKSSFRLEDNLEKYQSKFHFGYFVKTVFEILQSKLSQANYNYLSQQTSLTEEIKIKMQNMLFGNYTIEEILKLDDFLVDTLSLFQFMKNFIYLKVSDTFSEKEMEKFDDFEGIDQQNIVIFPTLFHNGKLIVKGHYISRLN